ncbi:MAG: heme ABC exporter ATP-binding protein CcmA [Pseudomonadota bacterium]
MARDIAASPLLQAVNLSCARGGAIVLEHVDFAVRPGETLILRGPNGIGKTTLLRTLAGLQPPRAGEVQGGAEQIAYAAHADGLKATLTVSENLAFWVRIFGNANVADALAAFDLTDLAGREAQNLSAGQKRRLGLARLLVTGRRIWILDEPTVSLDRASVAQFAAAVKAHCKKGGAAVIATHVDVGLSADVLELTPYRARLDATTADAGFDEAFL